MLTNNQNNTNRFEQGLTTPDLLNVQVESFSVQNAGSNATGLFFACRIGAPDLVKKISQQIEELQAHCRHYLFGDDFYSTTLNSTQNQLQKKLAAYFEDSFYQEKIKCFSELGVHYLSREKESPHKGRVNIYLARDNTGLPLRLSITLPSRFHTMKTDIDLSDFDKEKERIIQHNLTYIARYTSVEQEIHSIEDRLPESSDAIRLQLLNDFNKKWEGQLKITCEINQSTRTGETKVTDASGEIISSNSSNNFKIDRSALINHEDHTEVSEHSKRRLQKK
jgi:hypothetical protein